MHWKAASVELVDNGHTIQGNTAPGSYIMLEGARYELLQFHFHHPSEHTAGNRPYLMETHFVHKARRRPAWRIVPHTDKTSTGSCLIQLGHQVKLFTRLHARYLDFALKDLPILRSAVCAKQDGGGGGIRTPGTLTRPTVFETAPFNHSGTPPQEIHIFVVTRPTLDIGSG